MMSDEQVAEFHEKFANSFKHQERINEAMEKYKEELKSQYQNGLQLAIDILDDMRWRSFGYDIDDDGPRCPHCKEKLLG